MAQRARWLIAAVVLMLAACGTETGQPTAIASVPALDEVSLPPAEESNTPAAATTPEPLPSADVPSGEPSAATLPNGDYTAAADDLDAFVAAYRAAYPDDKLTDEALDNAGSRYCGYLARHASSNGVVDPNGALTEADLNEPGYSRESWMAVLEMAATDYCGQFSVDFSATGG